MKSATPSLRATPSKEGEFKAACSSIGRTANTATLSLNATHIEEGVRSPKTENSPSLEGVARSDGVAAPESEPATISDGVADFESRGNYKLYELPYNPALKQRAKELRKAGNLSEALFWNVVKNNQFNGLDFDRQRVIGNYIVDFYCHEHALVVEIDGNSHDDKKDYDRVRDEYLQALGLKVLYIQDIDVKQNLAGVIELLRQQLPRRYAPPLQIEGEFKE